MLAIVTPSVCMQSVGVSGLTGMGVTSLPLTRHSWTTSGELPLRVHIITELFPAAQETHDISHAHHVTQSYTSHDIMLMSPDHTIANVIHSS